MNLLGVQMKIKTAVVSQKLVKKDKSLAHELDELSTCNFILICFLLFTASEFLFSREGWIDINKLYPRRTVRIYKFITFFHSQQAFHRLKVVTENQFVVPVGAIFSKRACRLERDTHRPTDNFLFPLFTVINEFIFLLVGGEEYPRPFCG